MTILDLITAAVRKAGGIRQGQTLNAEEQTLSLDALNLMVEEWNTRQVFIYQMKAYTHALVANQQSYTIGSGGELNTARPVKIECAGIIQSNGVRTELELIPYEEWAKIISKQAADVVPLKLYNDNAYPLASLYLWPKPSGTPTLDLSVWQTIGGPFALTDVVALPPAYNKAITASLSVILAPEYGLQVPPTLVAEANAAMQALARINLSGQAAVQEVPTYPSKKAPPAEQQ